MTVRVRFHHRHNLHGRTDAISNLMEVCGELIEIDLRPRRSTRNAGMRGRQRRHALVYLNSLTRFHVRHKLTPLSHYSHRMIDMKRTISLLLTVCLCSIQAFAYG